MPGIFRGSRVLTPGHIVVSCSRRGSLFESNSNKIFTFLPDAQVASGYRGSVGSVENQNQIEGR